MGFFAEAARKVMQENEGDFKPLELDEMNVQAIFNRCLATAASTETVPAVLFPTITGYSAINNTVVDFDKNAILSNKRTIEYLFGQLYEVHSQNKKNRIRFKDFTMTYTGKIWSENKDCLLQLLYLSVAPGITLMTPFICNMDNTTSLKSDIKPTLSPKDPNFPTWWEEHKAEWEA